MGLFGFFIKRILKGLPRVEAASKGRGRAGPVETRPCGSPVRAPVPVKIETAETNPFATPEAAVRAAFDQVVGGTDIPERTRRDLFRAYSAAHRAGSPRAEEKAMEEYLGEADWRWPWFDEWVQRFRADGRWPYLVREYREAFEMQGRTVPEPAALSEALPLFSVCELRAWIRENGIRLPSCKRRRELEQAMIALVPWEKFSGFALGRHREHAGFLEIEHEAKRKRAGYMLLAHTVTMRAYTLRDHDRFRALRLREVVEPDDDPYAREAAERFNSGQSAELPPYYPGDRSRVSAK